MVVKMGCNGSLHVYYNEHCVMIHVQMQNLFDCGSPILDGTHKVQGRSLYGN